MRMWAQPQGVKLLLALIFDPDFDQILGEDVSLKQELVVGFQMHGAPRSGPLAWP